MTVKTRFAPSPTGYLHIGGLRTALYNYLFAKKHSGTFLLRIEDTDQTRYVEGAVESLIETLKRMGLTYQEGPFLQSQRLEIYHKYADQLLSAGHAYRCFCSKERLEELRKQQEAMKLSTKYDRRCLNLTKEEVEDKIKNGESSVIRLRIPDGETTFDDAIRGTITIPNSEIDDQVLIKTDGFPTYHLAVVVDDHLMGITHIIRGEEWISAVPKHVIMYQAFGFEMPIFAHLPHVLNPDRSKLSKRQGDVAVEDYLNKGYLPEALNNYVALLGFNPSGDREIYTIEELVEAFDLSRVNKSGAIFDVAKLNWMNAYYIRNIDINVLLELVKPFLGDMVIKTETLEKVLMVERSRATTLADFAPLARMYTTQQSYNPEALIWKKADKADASKQLEGVITFIQNLELSIFDDSALLESRIKEYIEKGNLQTGNVLWPMRVALSGSEQSASPFEIAWVLGKEETLLRLRNAVEKLNT
jgi:glutamyl-tRNA synthetase